MTRFVERTEVWKTRCRIFQCPEHRAVCSFG